MAATVVMKVAFARMFTPGVTAMRGLNSVYLSHDSIIVSKTSLAIERMLEFAEPIPIDKD